MGSAPMGPPRITAFVDRGTFRILLLTYFYLPKSARAYLFPKTVETRYFVQRPYFRAEPIFVRDQKDLVVDWNTHHVMLVMTLVLRDKISIHHHQ